MINSVFTTFFLWHAACFENTDFSDPDLTGGDSIISVGSAWASLASGLLLAKRQVVPSKNVFASIQYDFTNRSLLAAPLFKMSSIDDIRLKPDRKIVFTIKDREETWQWQSPHLQSQMIPTGIQRVHSINVSPDNTIWLLHDDKLLTIIDQNTAKRDTYSNAIYV